MGMREEVIIQQPGMGMGMGMGMGGGMGGGMVMYEGRHLWRGHFMEDGRRMPMEMWL